MNVKIPSTNIIVGPADEVAIIGVLDIVDTKGTHVTL